MRTAIAQVTCIGVCVRRNKDNDDDTQHRTPAWMPDTMDRDRTKANDIPLRMQQKCHRDECLLSTQNYYVVEMCALLQPTKQFICESDTSYGLSNSLVS